MDSNEFIFEAGRASPMGEGKYNFFTHNGDDNKIFDVIDSFASARLRRHQNNRSPAASSELTEDDIERAYDQLRFSLQPISGISCECCMTVSNFCLSDYKAKNCC